MNLPIWSSRDWRAMIALWASIAGAAILNGYSIWLVTPIVDFARADQGVRVRAIEALANSNYGLLRVIGAILLSLGLAINRRSLRASAFGASIEADSGGSRAMSIELVRRFAPWLMLGTILIELLLVGPGACRRMQRISAEARLQEEQGEAATASGRDAVRTSGDAALRERQSDHLTTRNEREIRNAQGSEAPVARNVTDAGLGGLCRRTAHRDSQRCRLRQPAAR